MFQLAKQTTRNQSERQIIVVSVVVYQAFVHQINLRSGITKSFTSEDTRE